MSTDRPATTDQTTQVHGADTAMAHWPVVSLRHSGDWGVHCLACSIDAGDYVPRCLVSADEWPPLVLRGAQPTDDAAVRASEAPGGADSPAPDAGATQGGDGGSAAESEPRPMPDPDSPGERMLTAARTVTGEALRSEGIWYSTESTNRITARILARLIPLIRAQVADDLRHQLQAEHDRVRDLEGATLSDERKVARHQGALAEAIRMLDHITRGDQ